MASGGVLEQQMRDTLSCYDMMRAGDKVLVAISGGPDSVSLLHALWALAAELDIELAAAHLNHKLRGTEADRDEQYVQQLCEGWNLDCFVRSEDIAGRAAAEGLSLEQAGRCARYEFFAALATEHGFDRVALGHTATDRVETLLINVLRGTGLYGLRSIPPVRGIFIRPLIDVARQATVEYCAAHKLRPRLDQTNLMTADFLRNKVRLELLPLLAEEYVANPERVFLRLTEAVEQELSWTEPLVRSAYEQAAHVAPDKVSLNRDKLKQMPPGLLQRVLRQAMVELHGHAADIEAVHYNDLHRLIKEGNSGAELHLPGQVRARIGYTDIELIVKPDRSCKQNVTVDLCRRLPVPGTVEVPELGVVVEARVLRQRPDELGDAAGRHIIVDAETVSQPLYIRTWCEGDVLQPLGMAGHKKLHDLFVDEKVPRSRRSDIPLVVTRTDEIVWVVGHRISEQFKVTEPTTEFLRLTARMTASTVTNSK